MELPLAPLLRLAWVAGTLPILLASLPVPWFGFLHRIILDFAARGKIIKSSSRKFTVPQRYFLHFYVVAVLVTTSMLLLMWFYAYGKMVPSASDSFQYTTVASHLTGGSHVFSFDKRSLTPTEHRHRVWRTVFVLLLMEAQVLRRLYETVNVFSYSSSARMHVMGYLTGLFFYTAAPLSLCCSVVPEAVSYASSHVSEFIVRGRAAMPDLQLDWWEYARPFLQLGWCQWAGAGIFIWGWCHQLRCHAILGLLREHRGADEYVIPHGDWFEYVSCAHYLAEIVIYASILLASGGLDLTIWLLFFFVVSNLVFAAAETHRWYHQKFENYPVTRRAILPYVY
ncbi:Polyprenol reductase protein [Dioscorea alata]|uniref:Polyprenol reductase protein n=1 Tax=Dioscorea alata TaxID=55571 RepID=A0ACB7UV65_DIOAL|nr:Polyprenol reductase protein [Dioscorea alata]